MDGNRDETAQKLMKALKQFSKLHIQQQSPIPGLKASEVFVLFGLKEMDKPDMPGIKVSEISSMMGVTSPSITQLLNGLESQGYVERSMDQEDRRAVRVSLSEKGKEATQKAYEAFFAFFSGLVDYLGQEKSEELAELLTKASDYFKEVRRNNP